MSEKKIYGRFLPLIGACVLVAGMWLGYCLAGGDRTTVTQRKLARVLEIIEDDYVDALNMDRVLYTDNEASAPAKLGARLESVNPQNGRPDFGPAEALSFMVFILLYCPCLATVTAIARECGSWRWAAFSVVYNTVIAWIVAFGVYRIALLC